MKHTITMKTSTGGSFGIRKNLQKFSTELEGVVKGTKNRIVAERYREVRNHLWSCLM